MLTFLYCIGSRYMWSISLHIPRGVHLKIFGTNFWNALHAKNPKRDHRPAGWRDKKTFTKKVIRFLVVNTRSRKAHIARVLSSSFSSVVKSRWIHPCMCMFLLVFGRLLMLIYTNVCVPQSGTTTVYLFLPVMQYHVVIFWVLSLHPRRTANCGGGFIAIFRASEKL